MKPHGRDCPDRCSLCKGATPRIVTLADGCVLVDGLVTHRELVPPTPMQEHARKGRKP